MNFELTEEQIQVRDMVREFAAKEVAPYIREWDAKGEFHREVLDKMGELGILGTADSRAIRRALDSITSASRLACEELEYVDTFAARDHERARRAEQLGAAPVGH